MEVGAQFLPSGNAFTRSWLAQVDWETGQALLAHGERWRLGILLYQVGTESGSLLRYPRIAGYYNPQTQQLSASWLDWKVWERLVSREDRQVAAFAARRYEQWRTYFAGQIPPPPRSLEAGVVGEADLRVFFGALARRLGGIPPETLERAVTAVGRCARQHGIAIDESVMALAARVRQLPWDLGEPLVCSGGTRMTMYRALLRSLEHTNSGSRHDWEYQSSTSSSRRRPGFER